jgi:DNA processing protein
MHLIEDPMKMWGDEELKYWLALDQCSGCGLRATKLISVFDRFETVSKLWTATPAELKEMGGWPYALGWINAEFIEKFVAKRASIDPDSLLEKLAKADVRAFPVAHPLYPFPLRNIHDPPTVLYAKGQMSIEQITPGIGVVGTRTPSAYGQKFAKQFGHDLGQSAITVVSGMALGVDSLAHWGAIESGGKTVAVVATGPDICYPSSNKPLYAKLTTEPKGLVVSEYFPGTTPEKWHFPSRNRIISGLGQGLLVIEAGQSSGSLITARQAFEQDRQVFALPGRIDQPMSEGTNRLIASNMAAMVVNVEEIKSSLSLVTVLRPRLEPIVLELFGNEKEVHELLSNEPVHFDQMAEKTGLQAGALSSTLTMLELAGIAERLPGDWYVRK